MDWARVGTEVCSEPLLKGGNIDEGRRCRLTVGRFKCVMGLVCSSSGKLDGVPSPSPSYFPYPSDER